MTLQEISRKMEANSAHHKLLMDTHEALVVENERLCLVRLGLSFFSIRHHQIIGASRVLRKLSCQVVADNTALFLLSQQK